MQGLEGGRAVQDTGKLDGKVAIVTGAGSSGPGWGTGKAMAVLFAREGAKVVLVDRYEDRAAATLAIIDDEGGEATVVIVDLATPTGPDEVAAAAVERFGGIDILVNNAAITAAEGILATTPERYAEVMGVNLTAPFMMTRAALPAMVAGGGGAVVFVTSIAALRGLSGTENSGVVYATAKSGLVGLATNLADSFGRKGIRFNCIAPGIIDTPMRAAGVISAGFDPSQIDMSDHTALGFEGDAWDIARAALFVAGPDGRYITGVHLPVDGGTIARSH
jgi:NAD(P)-dependent dehydrogenase (short-subunit alcohol dehydrogenase family)